MTRVILLYWRDDPAGNGIAKRLGPLLREEPSLKELPLIELQESPLYLDSVKTETYRIPNDAYLVILSKHASASARPSLTVHHTGNLDDEAVLGGSPRRLSVASPILTKALLIALHRRAIDGGYTDFYIGYEATHHGPTDLENPLTFIEIGSSMEYWVREDLHTLIALSVIDALRIIQGKELTCREITASYGETHYPSRLTRRVIESELCVGHIIPKYALSNIDEDIIEQSIHRSSPAASRVLIEKKSVKSWVVRMILEVAKREGVEVSFY